MKDLTIQLNALGEAMTTWSPMDVLQCLEVLDARGWIDWTPEPQGVVLRWKRPRQATSTVSVDRSRLNVLLQKWKTCNAMSNTRIRHAVQPCSRRLLAKKSRALWHLRHLHIAA